MWDRAYFQADFTRYVDAEVADEVTRRSARGRLRPARNHPLGPLASTLAPPGAGLPYV